MPRICPKCGAKLKQASRVCPACGSALEDDVQIYPSHADGSARKSGDSSRRVLAGAVCAVVVIGGALGLWQLSKEHTPEKTAAEFQAALASADFDRLCAVAEPSGNAAFTEDALAPMFTLYHESAAFRQQTAQLSTTDAPCLHMQRRSSFPFSSYRILVDACKLDVSTNIADAAVTAGSEQVQSVPQEKAGALDGAGYTPDAPNLVHATAEFVTLYPGLYDLSVSYTSSIGQDFEASTSVSLMQPTQTTLDLDYTSLYVWNSSSMSVDLSVDGSYYTTLASGSALQLAPLLESSVVTASCTTDAGETLVDSVPASNRSFEVLFSLGTVDVYNDYDADMAVQLNGSDYCTIPAKSLQTVSGVSLGSTLSFTLTDCDVFRPYEYQLTYDYDSICPILALSDEARLAVSAVLQDTLTSAPLDGDGFIGSFDDLLVNNGWSRSEVVVSDVTVEDVYAMQTLDDGTLLSLNGFYTCTNITLPDISLSDDPPESDDGALDFADAPDAVQNPQQQSFHASVFFDGDSWFVTE